MSNKKKSLRKSPKKYTNKKTHRRYKIKGGADVPPIPRPPLLPGMSGGPPSLQGGPPGMQGGPNKGPSSSNDSPLSPDSLSPQIDETPMQNDDLDVLMNNNELTAKSGVYNSNENTTPLTGLAKKKQEAISGLKLQYPGYLNTKQENALSLKLDDVREYGFPGLDIKTMSQFTPKINYKLMYETDALSAILSIPDDEFDTQAEELKSNEQRAAEEQALSEDISPSP